MFSLKVGCDIPCRIKILHMESYLLNLCNASLEKLVIYVSQLESLTVRLQLRPLKPDKSANTGKPN